MLEYAQLEVGTLTLRLDARQLENPDLDLRYAIPELLDDRSNGLIRDGGYDYETDHVLAIYLLVDDAPVATALIETDGSFVRGGEEEWSADLSSTQHQRGYRLADG